MTTPPPPVAGIDIGTNSVRILILDASGRELFRQMEITRLGQGVDQTRRLHPEAVARTLSVLRSFGEHLQRLNVSKVRATATSAARDASNSQEFFDAVEEAIGHRPELLSGSEEARLSFAGATAQMPQQLGPFMIFDIGGGSTEFAFGSAHPERFLSVDMGGVRITERFLTTDPPTETEVGAARRHVRELLREVEAHMHGVQARTWLGLAGTVTAFAARAAGLSHYDAAVTHGYILTAAHIHRFTHQLLHTPLERRKELLVEPKRAAMIVGGAVVLSEIIDAFHLDVVRTSETDILDGLAQSCLTQPVTPPLQ